MPSATEPHRRAPRLLAPRLLALGLLALGLLALAAPAAAADGQPAPAPTDPTAEARIAAARAQDATLRRRRLADLRALARHEPRPSGRSEAYLALAETLAEDARAARIGLIPDITTEADREAEALRAEDRALAVLELLLQRGDALPTEQRDRAGFLYAELMLSQDDTRKAEAALATIERTTDDPRRRARAAALRGQILGKSWEEPALQASLAAYTRALVTAPTIENRLGAAAAAARLGRADEALAHYAALLQLRPAQDDHEGRAARRFAAKATARLLTEYRAPAAAFAHVEALGPAGHPVWYPLGESYGLRDAPADMHRALDRARALDPEPRERFDAEAALIDAALRLGDRPQAAARARALGDALTALPEDLQDRAEWRAVAESAIKRAVERIYHDPPAAWTDPDAHRVLDTYLAHFRDAPYVPHVWYVRGVRRAEAATGCADHRAAAEDFRRAFDDAADTWPRLATEAGLAAIQSLAACRPAEIDLDGRPPATEVDPALISLAGRALDRRPEPPIEARIDTWLGLARLATGDDGGAIAALTRATEIEGPHLETAAVQLLRALKLAGDVAALERRADAFADDPRLSPALRAAMRERAWAAGYALAADATTPAERARRLLDYARDNPDAPGAGPALVAAAAALGEAGEWGQATATLEAAAAQEAALDRIGDAHLALADLLERQGRPRDAAERTTRWLLAQPPDAPDRNTIQALTAARWIALGDPLRAHALTAPEADRDATRLDAAIAALHRADRPAARALAADEPRDRALRALHAELGRCLAGDPAPITALARRRRDPRQDALLAACAVTATEALLDDRPPPGAADALEDISARITRLEALALAAQPAADPITWIRIQLVGARLYATYVRLAAGAGDTLDPDTRALIAGAAAQAWATWLGAAQYSDALGLDGVLSARVGAALGDLVTLPEITAP
ncbi:MAG: hypothetical protein R3F65_20485 [bacterium]